MTRIRLLVWVRNGCEPVDVADDLERCELDRLAAERNIGTADGCLRSATSLAATHNYGRHLLDQRVLEQVNEGCQHVCRDEREERAERVVTGVS